MASEPLPRHIQQLEAEARYQRQRYDLYRARAYSMRPTSESRMRELKQWAEAAEERLRHARAQQP